MSGGRLGSLMKRIGPPEVITVFAFELPLLLDGLLEWAGLAMIIGSYIMGLSLSRTDLALEIHRRLDPIIDVLVPVFFCVMGMLIDLHALAVLWKAGLVFSVLSVFSKFSVTHCRHWPSDSTERARSESGWAWCHGERSR